MYECIVIEDEERILSNICRRIEKLSSRFHVAAPFTNPLCALQYLKDHPVDIVLTDIRMPEMDGLTLLQKLEELQAPLTVIISSYQDFSYARSAIRLHVSEYLLKPFLDEELCALLSRLAEQLDEKQIDALADELTAFLKGGAAGATLRRLFPGEGYYALAALIPQAGASQWDCLPAPHITRTQTLLPLAVGEYTLCFCAAFDGGAPVERLAREWTAQGGSAVYTSGCQTLDELPALYQRLRARAALGLFPGKASCVCLDALKEPARDLGGLQEAYRRLSLTAPGAGRDAISSQLSSIAQRFAELGLSQYELRQQLMILFLRLYTELRRTFPDFKQMDETLSAVLSGCVCYGDLAGDLIDEVLAVAAPEADDTKKPQLAQAVREYLDVHVAEVIGLETLAGHFGYSQTYILRVFREAFQASPIDYLIAAKMEKAKELLRLRPDLTVREVAEQTGYSNQYYFSRAFKHAVGSSPAEYRKTQ